MVDAALTCDVVSVPHFFGTRHSEVDLADRLQLGSLAVGTPTYPLIAALKQIHSTEVVVVSPTAIPGPLDVSEADALVTNRRDTLLVVRTADCVPILLVDAQSTVVAAIHAGWRGAVGGILLRTIHVCRTLFGVQVNHLKVMIGPSIGPCCYEVDEAVIQPLREGFGFWEEVLSEKQHAKAKLDLKKLIYLQAREEGVPEGNISSIKHCTYCRADLFFSYRREGQVKGTMVSGIMIPAA